MHIAFNSPWYLLLLLFVPAIWYFSRDSLSGMGPYRRFLALAFRTLVLTLIVVSLAEIQFLRINDRVTVIYLLDQSDSIPKSHRETMLNFVREDVAAHRNDSKRDRVAVIVFGRNATIEEAPVDDNQILVSQLGSVYDLRPEATNLEQAMKLAQATFPEDSSRRIVIVSDGNETEGDARAIAEMMAADDGVGIDVVPIELQQRAEVEIDKVAIPADTRKGQPFDASVVLNNLAEATAEDDGNVTGRVLVYRRQGKSDELISEQNVALPPGKTVLQFRHTIEQADFYEYRAEFIADHPNVDDVLTENNRATAFTQVLGAANVLLIEDWEHPGEFDTLIDRLRDQEIQITVQSSNTPPASLGELQRYDCVVLANVPRSSGNVDTQTGFSDEQISFLVQNTHKLGCGLIMLGGPNSFGAGGWANTELEKAMPVDFQIYNAKVVPVGALAMVMHASEMAQGNYWQKIISREALKVLGPHDYCGVIHWEGKEAWLWGQPYGLVKVGQNKEKMMARLGRMTPGDMPEFDPSLNMAVAAFSKLDAAAVKHMIVISDGDPSPPTRTTLQAFKDLGAKISTVAVGTHGPAGSSVLSRIAKFTGGKYYVVKNPQALPRIFQKETMRIARPLVKETPGMQPNIDFRHEIMNGIDSVPTIDGFVLTSKKKNSLVDVIMTSPDPPTVENATVLAAWTYGAGRTAVFTSDAGYRWASLWTEWDGYDQFFGQLIRWAMRPTGDQGNFTCATQVRDGKGKVIITAHDDDGNHLNFLEFGGDVIQPDLEAVSVNLKQVAPGRYEGEFDATTPGSYFLAMSPGPGFGSLRTGLNVPYSAEYRDRETNQELLKSLAAVKPRGGETGKVIKVSFEPGQVAAARIDTFRRDLPKSISTQDIWPLMVLLGSCVFLADIFVRRVAVSFDWVRPLAARLKSRFTGEVLDQQPDERMARLRSKKAQVGEEIHERRAAARFEPTDPNGDVDMAVLDQAAQMQAQAVEKKQREAITPTEEEDNYTSRLLKARDQARKDQVRKDTRNE